MCPKKLSLAILRDLSGACVSSALPWAAKVLVTQSVHDGSVCMWAVAMFTLMLCLGGLLGRPPPDSSRLQGRPCLWGRKVKVRQITDSRAGRAEAVQARPDTSCVMRLETAVQQQQIIWQTAARTCVQAALVYLVVRAATHEACKRPTLA